MPPQLLQLIQSCWSEYPALRPDFPHIKSAMRRINRCAIDAASVRAFSYPFPHSFSRSRCRNGDTSNLLDNLLSRMELYANNLEDLVAARTADYLTQKKRAEGAH